MKRVAIGIISLLLSATLLSGCISFKEFTDEELERLSATSTELNVEA